MSYLYNKDVNVLNANAVVTTTNPFPVVMTGGNTNTQLVDFPKSAVSAFGELSVIENTPVVQLDCVYGFDSDSMMKGNVGTGSSEANAQTSFFTVSSGTTLGSQATLRSKRFMKYRPGQGAIGRFTAMYTLGDVDNKYGVDNATQRAGFQNATSGYGFGFSGITANTKTKTFGIYHVYGGKPEIQTLTINTAPTGTQTVTVTLDGTPYTATVHSGNTANATAEIASGNTYGGTWFVDYQDSHVTFSSLSAGVRSGTYSISATGTGTLVNGSFSQVTAGANNTTDWTYQADWNGPNTIANLDPSKLNVYQVDYRWLGAGVVRFFMEDPTSGDLVQVHQQHWANQHTTPHVDMPSFRIGYVAAVGASTPSQTAIVKGASIMGAIQGKITPTSLSKSWYALNSTNLITGSIYHLLSIKLPYTKAGKQNTQEIQLQDMTISAQGNDPSVVHIFINGNTSSKLVFTTTPNDVFVSEQIGPTMNTATDLPVASFTVGVNGTSEFDLIPYRLVLSPGDVLSVAIQSTSGLTRTAVAVTWVPE